MSRCANSVCGKSTYPHVVLLLYFFLNAVAYSILMEQLKEYRCMCGKLLFKGQFENGVVEIKCRHCRKVSAFLHTNAPEYVAVPS